MDEIVLTVEMFQHFTKFLKKNGFYADYVYNFFINDELKFDDAIHQFKDYTDIMLARAKNNIFQHYNKYGTMFFTFASFRWAGYTTRDTLIDISFTKKWCSVGVKWALYCVENGFRICSENRFKQLLTYYKGNNWLSKKILTQEEFEEIDSIILNGKSSSL